MKTIVYSLLLLLLMFAVVVCTGDEQIQSRESQIKAAFLYNFIMFTEWPADKLSEPNTITIGLLGEHPFGDAFDPIKSKTIKKKRLTVKDFGKFRRSFPEDDAGKLEFANYIEQLRKCHVLFICDSEHENYKAIIDMVKGYSVLTVGETEDFLGFGGIITFIPGTEKPVFEVNIDSCENENLKISSKVLRLARKVIDYDAPDAVNKNK